MIAASSSANNIQTTRLQEAINKGLYMGWLGLTTEQVTKYLDKLVHTIIGHTSLVHKGIRSTNTIDDMKQTTSFTEP
eukprot:jgi/Psemu1/11360/gm1.11360_g